MHEPESPLEKVLLGSLLLRHSSGAWGVEPVGEQTANVRVIRATNFDGDQLRYDSAAGRRFSEQELRAKILQANDILLETSGGGPSKPVGRAAVHLPPDDFIYACSNFLRFLRPDRRKVHPQFLAAYLQWNYRSHPSWKYQQQTTGIINLHLPSYLSQLVLLPPRHEQERIVDVLDAIDEAIRASSSACSKLQTLQWGALSSLIAAGIQTVPRGGWTWRRVEEVGDVRLGRQRSPAHDEGPWMAPYLRVANVMDGCIDYADVLRMNFTPKERRTYELRRGDILLNEGQSLELVGRCAIYDGLHSMFFQNTLVRFRPRLSLPEFARAVFKYWLETGEFAKVARQTTSIAHLGADRFAAMNFPLAPPGEQQKIVAVLGATQERIRAEQTRLDKLRLVKQGLAEDLLSGKVRPR